GPEAAAVARAAGGDVAVAERDVLLDELFALPAAAQRAAVAADLDLAIAALESLRDGDARTRAALPLLAALAVPGPAQLEHDPPPPAPRPWPRPRGGPPAAAPPPAPPRALPRRPAATASRARAPASTPRAPPALCPRSSSRSSIATSARAATTPPAPSGASSA